jgi:hypothetical protein
VVNSFWGNGEEWLTEVVSLWRWVIDRRRFIGAGSEERQRLELELSTSGTWSAGSGDGRRGPAPIGSSRRGKTRRRLWTLQRLFPEAAARRRGLLSVAPRHTRAATPVT